MSTPIQKPDPRVVRPGSIRLWLYRCLARCLSSLRGQWIFRLSDDPLSESPRRRYWFHAASAGELEILAPLVLEAAEADVEIILTSFSVSASHSLQKLAHKVETLRARVPYAGASPPEGSWETVLQKLPIDAFITAKYEAWPDLWASLSRLQVPLIVVGAQLRPSLVWVRRILSGLGVKLPRITFLTNLEHERITLQKVFPQSRIEVSGDPRWDRAFQRLQAGSPRASELIRVLALSPRPWGCLAQIWPEDFAIVEKALVEMSGTIWIIPHVVDSKMVDSIESWLSKLGIPWIKSTEVSEGQGKSERAPAKVVLINEMGFLLELYRGVDWAYVGGGFGQGPHSTLEPAVHGIPISCGPKRAQKFSEINEIQATGQLTLVESSQAFFNWWTRAVGMAPAHREAWLLQSRARLGATRRAAQWIEQSLN